MGEMAKSEGSARMFGIGIGSGNVGGATIIGDSGRTGDSGRALPFSLGFLVSELDTDISTGVEWLVLENGVALTMIAKFGGGSKGKI